MNTGKLIYQIRNAHSGNLFFHVYSTNLEYVSALVQIPNKLEYISASADGDIKIWNIKNTKKPIFAFERIEECKASKLKFT